MDQDKGDNNLSPDTVDIFKLLMKLVIKANYIRESEQAKERYVAKTCIRGDKPRDRYSDNYDQ